MESLQIKSFGPIENAKIEIRDINIFMGGIGGKSTAAKLVAIFKSLSSKSRVSLTEFRKLLADYNIDFKINGDTLLHYTHDNTEIKLADQALTITSKENGAAARINPIYIPAERLFFSTVSQSIFSLINYDISLPKRLIDFGAKFEQARNAIKKVSIKFLDAEYSYEDNTNYLELSNNVWIFRSMLTPLPKWMFYKRNIGKKIVRCHSGRC